MGKNFRSGKANLPRRLFWDFQYDDIEWHEEYLTVIERVLEHSSGFRADGILVGLSN